MLVSRIFRDRLKLHNEPAYRLATRVGMHPATLSKLIHGAERAKPDDARIVSIGAKLGLSADQCFEREDVEAA